MLDKSEFNKETLTNPSACHPPRHMGSQVLSSSGEDNNVPGEISSWQIEPIAENREVGRSLHLAVTYDVSSPGPVIQENDAAEAPVSLRAAPLRRADVHKQNHA